jgi:multidrug resistance efflux pump
MDDDDLDHLERIERKINRILERSITIMADLSALNAAVTQLQTDEQAAAAELAALAAQVSSLTAGTISQAQIDALTASVTSTAQALSDATTAASGTPAPTTTTPGTPGPQPPADPNVPPPGVATGG